MPEDHTPATAPEQPQQAISRLADDMATLARRTEALAHAADQALDMPLTDKAARKAVAQAIELLAVIIEAADAVEKKAWEIKACCHSLRKEGIA